MKHLRHLNKYFWKYRYRLILGVLFVAFSNIFGVLPPQVIRHAFDLVKENIGFYQSMEGFELQGRYYGLFSSLLLMFGITVLLLAMIKGIFMFLMRQTLIVMSRLIEYDLRNEIYDHYQQLSSAFYKRSRTGDLMSRATEDVNRVRMYLGPAIMYSINLTVLIITVVISMLNVNRELTFYVVLPLPLLALLIYYVNTVIHKKSELIQIQMSRLTNIAQEAFSGIRVVKAYTQEQANLHFFEEESETYRQKSLSLARVNAFFVPLMILLIGISTIATIYIGGMQVINGYITYGNIAEFIIYVGMLTWPVASIGWVASIIQRAAASQKRINEFLQTRPEIISPNQHPLVLDGNIEFNQVDFTYPDTGIHALKKVSFHIKKGEKWALIGRTGSGKSTIAELLVRKYDVDKGNIFLDGIDISQVNLKELRRQIAYVPQDVFLFSETIKNNILFGYEQDTEMDKIELAARQASVNEDINALPEKYFTMVGERGVTLSGGQKQRISIARALIKNPQIVILDDCLSAVDAETEQEIIDQLNDFLADKTALIITHRVFSLMQFDRILVLENGRIIEEGTHNELLALNGSYTELYEIQKTDVKKSAI